MIRLLLLSVLLLFISTSFAHTVLGTITNATPDTLVLTYSSCDNGKLTKSPDVTLAPFSSTTFGAKAVSEYTNYIKYHFTYTPKDQCAAGHAQGYFRYHYGDSKCTGSTQNCPDTGKSLAVKVGSCKTLVGESQPIYTISYD